MPELPLFYHEQLHPGNGMISLDEEARRHVVTVLRMQQGEYLELTNGKGLSTTAVIREADKKKWLVELLEPVKHQPREKKLRLGITLLKNAARFEWMLEKVTEIGITHIFPLLTARTSRQHFRQERMQQIIVSACLQSRQFHFPELSEPVPFEQLMAYPLPDSRSIAPWMEGDKSLIATNAGDAVLLIGLEGEGSWR